MEPMQIGGEGESHQQPAEGRSDTWRAALGFVGVVAGLVAVLWLLGLSSDNTAQDDSEADGSDTEQAEETPTTTAPDEPQPDDDTSASEATAEPADTDRRLSPLQGTLVYLSDNHVIQLDLATGDLARLPIEVTSTIVQIEELDLLADGNRTVGLPRQQPLTEALLISSGSRVVRAATEHVDYWILTEPDGPDGMTRLSVWHNYGFMSTFLTAPPGSEIVINPDAGLLLVSPVGRTFRPSIRQFEPFSDHRVLAATRLVQVEQQCDDQLRCSIVDIDRVRGVATELPDRFTDGLDEISISPDGRWLLSDTSPAWLLDRDARRLRLLEVGGYGSPRWAQDSQSVAWLTTDRTPALVWAQTDPPEGDPGWHVVELAGLGADPSPGTSFLLLP